jgi:hypothetical protein
MALNDDALRSETQTSLIYSLTIIFIILSTASVFLRLYTRARILNSSVLGADDVTITIAQVLAISVSVTTILGMSFLFYQTTDNELIVCRGSMGSWKAYQICPSRGCRQAVEGPLLCTLTHEDG